MSNQDTPKWKTVLVLSYLAFYMSEQRLYMDDEVKEKIHLYFEQQILFKEKTFANGRLARNIYDDLVMNHARRVIKMDNPSIADLSAIISEDFNF